MSEGDFHWDEGWLSKALDRMLVAPRLNGGEGFWTPQWWTSGRDVQRMSGLGQCSSGGSVAACALFSPLSIAFKTFGDVELPQRSRSWGWSAAAFSTAEGRWGNPAGAPVVTFSLGSMPCEKSASCHTASGRWWWRQHPERNSKEVFISPKLFKQFV